MFTQKIATYLTIVSILFLIITCTINVLDFYVIDSFNPHTIHTYPPAYHLTTLVPVSWYLTFICSALILVSWCWNLIICIQLSKTTWWTWFNIFVALIIGIYVLVEIYFFVTSFPNRFFLLYLPYGIIFQSPNVIPVTWGIYAAWFVQYIINSVYVMTCYKHMKHYLYPHKEEVPKRQRSRYEAVKAEVDARAERMACNAFGIPEGGYEFGMCHRVWKYKKEILKTEYGIDWHSPAELNPHTCFD